MSAAGQVWAFLTGGGYGSRIGAALFGLLLGGAMMLLIMWDNRRA